MAIVKYPQLLKQDPNRGPDAFDVLHHPGTPTPHSGIYRCEACGHSAVSTAGHPLPPQSLLVHSHVQPIQWRLVVMSTIA